MGQLKQSPAEIDAKIIGLIARLSITDASEITPDNDLTADLGLDSLDQADMVMSLEDDFGIDIPDDEAQKIKTVGQALAYVHEHLGHAGS